MVEERDRLLEGLARLLVEPALVDQVRQFEAQSKLAEANADFTARRLSSAEAKYAELVTIYSGYLSAEQLEQARQLFAAAD